MHFQQFVRTPCNAVNYPDDDRNSSRNKTVMDYHVINTFQYLHLLVLRWRLSYNLMYGLGNLNTENVHKKAQINNTGSLLYEVS
jgi:hypothetical protein